MPHEHLPRRLQRTPWSVTPAVHPAVGGGPPRWVLNLEECLSTDPASVRPARWQLAAGNPVFWERSSMIGAIMEDREAHSLKVSAVKGSKLKKSA